MLKIPSSKSVTHVILAQIFGLQNLLPVCSYTSNAIEKEWYFMSLWTEKRTCVFCFMVRKEMKLPNTSNPFSFSRDNYSLLLPLSADPIVFQSSLLVLSLSFTFMILSLLHSNLYGYFIALCLKDF